MTIIIFLIVVIAGSTGVVAALGYRRILHRAKSIERGLKMVPLLIHLPPPSSDTQAAGRDVREVRREKLSQAEALYNLIAGTAQQGFKSRFYGERHVALEIIATGGTIHFYAAVPVTLVPVIEKALLTAYPGARVEEVADRNVFSEKGKLIGTLGGELVLKAESAYPIATYKRLDVDPMEAILNSVSSLNPGDGAAVQLLLRPATRDWVKEAMALVKKLRQGKASGGFTPLDFARAAVQAPGAKPAGQPATPAELSGLELSVMEAVEDKTRYPGYEILIRLVASSPDVGRSQIILQNLVTAFSLLDAPGLNGFKYLPAADVQGLATAFIFRFFPPTVNQNILSSSELATLFHLPDAQFTPVAGVERQLSKQVDGPSNVPQTGLLFGYNFFREVKKEIRLSPEDRRRHTYIVGQTGTGKSTFLENLAVQDMLSGNGFAFIDPHGDTAERLISMVPKSRAEDVIYFNPGDTETPLGLNIFEFTDPSQKDFLIQEAIGMLYKLYDPGHTGIIGPRYEHWFRNAALTLMSDPNGSTFIEVPKVFTDTDFLKSKFKYVTDPTVVDFWTKEMAQTSDYHKSEMLGWFVSKFGAFVSNELMRNVIGQTQSAFNLREVMDQKKILIVNLSKGRVGELNSQLLGMMLVTKIQAAAMSRATVPEDQRPDFSLYVDEFQNFSTDSFATILSEARKYRLNLIVANQFIGQLTSEIRDAVFGNVGSVVAFRVGPEDADFLVKQFAPVFDARDLVNIPNANVVVRLMIGGLPSQPFTLQTLAPLSIANAELGLAIKQLSAAKFGHPRAQVEAAILARLANQPAPPLPVAPSATTPSPAPANMAVPIPPPAVDAVGPPPFIAPPPVNADLQVPPVVTAVTAPPPSGAAASEDKATLKFTDITRGIADPTVRPPLPPVPPREPAAMAFPSSILQPTDPLEPAAQTAPMVAPASGAAAVSMITPALESAAPLPAPPLPDSNGLSDVPVLSPWLSEAASQSAAVASSPIVEPSAAAAEPPVVPVPLIEPAIPPLQSSMIPAAAVEPPPVAIPGPDRTTPALVGEPVELPPSPISTPPPQPPVIAPIPASPEPIAAVRADLVPPPQPASAQPIPESVQVPPSRPATPPEPAPEPRPQPPAPPPQQSAVPDGSHLLVGIEPHGKRKRRRKRHGGSHPAESDALPRAAQVPASATPTVAPVNASPADLPVSVPETTAVTAPVQTAEPSPAPMPEPSGEAAAATVIGESPQLPPLDIVAPGAGTDLASQEKLNELDGDQTPSTSNGSSDEMAEAAPAVMLPRRDRLGDASVPNQTDAGISTMLPEGEAEAILAQSKKPEPEPVSDQAHKLQPGEVYVDEHGNVTVGE